MRLLLATFGVAVASALIPVINIEAYIAGIGALVTTFGVWPVSSVAAAGQTVGKAFWYEVGRTSMRWRYIQQKMESPRWQQQYEKMKTRVDDRPWVGMTLLFVSATLGVPPLAILAVLAGQLRFHRVWFYLTTLIGRTLRFAAVLGGVSLLERSGLFG
ncbi:MAG: VTT domain-containing protein [Propionibacteriales bacterium]|nr:VTT domain-containing protein [Propionibacteriales bacterium]